MNTGVINFFDEYLYIHLIIQGLFFSICVLSGLYMLFKSAIRLTHAMNIQAKQLEAIKKYISGLAVLLISIKVPGNPLKRFPMQLYCTVTELHPNQEAIRIGIYRIAFRLSLLKTRTSTTLSI